MIYDVSTKLVSGNLGFRVMNKNDKQVSVVVAYRHSDGSYNSKTFGLEAKSEETCYFNFPFPSCNVSCISHLTNEK